MLNEEYCRAGRSVLTGATTNPKSVMIPSNQILIFVSMGYRNLSIRTFTVKGMEVTGCNEHDPQKGICVTAHPDWVGG